MSASDLSAIAVYAQWVGVETTLLVSRPAIIAEAHAVGLQVAAWTVRPENHFLPERFSRGDDPASWGDQAGWAAHLAELGVDAVFTDAPDAVRKRHHG